MEWNIGILTSGLLTIRFSHLCFVFVYTKDYRISKTKRRLVFSKKQAFLKNYVIFPTVPVKKPYIFFWNPARASAKILNFVLNELLHFTLLHFSSFCNLGYGHLGMDFFSECRIFLNIGCANMSLHWKDAGSWPTAHVAALHLSKPPAVRQQLSQSAAVTQQLYQSAAVTQDAAIYGSYLAYTAAVSKDVRSRL
jgi:hypothetical protein